MVEIRSETLWTHGPQAAVDRVLSLIRAASGTVESCKVSRADLCVDVLMNVKSWDYEVREHLVTQAAHVAPYYANGIRTGIQIGKGKMVGRMYDKPLEIVTRGGKKQWMFGVWGIKSVAEDHRIIRVEFESKRETIKALGLDSFDDLMGSLPALWSYCTQKWLRVVDNPKKHHTRQKLLPWWPIVQTGFAGAQDAKPLIRAEAVRADEEQLSKQLLGQLTSLVALDQQGEMIGADETLDLESHLAMVIRVLRTHGWDDHEFTERVKRKQAKFQRHTEKFRAAERARAAVGVSLRRSSATARQPL